MDFKTLIIEFIYKSKQKNQVLLSATFMEKEREEASKMPKSFFITLYKNKYMTIYGDQIIYTKILDVEVSSSIAGFLNVDFLTDLKEQKGFAINAIVEIS